MVIQKIRLAGKRFVIVEEKEYEHLMQELKKIRTMSAQDWGDVAESKRRVTEPGESISWQRIKAERTGKISPSNGKRGR
jgi:hypothetical protein